MNPRRPISTAVAALLLTGIATTGVAAGIEDAVAARRLAFDLAYNLDHDEAVRRLRQAVHDNPSDPAGHRALASVLWLNMLFRRGAITVDHYLGSFSRTQVELSKPPADLDAEFRTHVARAIQLAEARVAAAPRDAQAHYELGLAIALQASHTATVEGKLFAGFKAARRAYDEHEKVLSIDPARKDAGLIVGTYRYVVSTLSLPMRMMAYVVGFGGGRQRGLQMVQDASLHAGDSRTDALFALVLLYNREHRYDEALKVLGELRRSYPRNRLVVLETGATALRAGRHAEADALLTEGLAMLAKETRAKIPGEAALWRYKRGAARVGLGRIDAAKSDLRAAIEPDAQNWVQGRAHAELARLAIRGGDRPAARESALRAETLCQQGNDAPCVTDARNLMRNAGGQ
jgi:tetratricopeptide (TPR) repeat protein